VGVGVHGIILLLLDLKLVSRIVPLVVQYIFLGRHLLLISFCLMYEVYIIYCII